MTERDAFPLPLYLEKLRRRNFKLIKDFPFSVGGVVGIVPSETITDFASIPWFVYWLLPPFDDYDKPAVVHDFHYRTGTMARSIADSIFLEGMVECGVPEWKRRIVYRSVRLCGWKHYRKCRK